ncbi:3-hydroxyacyl-[acyl-carrier-protein] dehydratase [Lentzea atacamensis]|uniref:3-hydroxyacyl-[acyl-carrier-protein] dehydratase n=2 Tax=Lentzea TaxID=165301 RepID=A0A316HTY5_9PSEU|nr:3-hydroxyacyl-ACP dehydratase FabZ family protein [Lentzea atacamensis]PWK84852.1 3-hydroxyacyl-[acyl-carrier-protein] dehydratase [Lentzea atacamensis]RAS65883.1 3-hydroxyacyl-[acyl-carrier-protein] dehydratase [Lentzea atacamensis]
MTDFDETPLVEPGRRATALRNVTATLDVFATHFPRFPVLPGVLLLEDMVWLARLAAPGGATRWRVADVSRVQFRRAVQPGDQVRFTAEVVDSRDTEVSCRVDATVDGRVVAGARRVRLARRRT